MFRSYSCEYICMHYISVLYIQEHVDVAWERKVCIYVSMVYIDAYVCGMSSGMVYEKMCGE